MFRRDHLLRASKFRLFLSTQALTLTSPIHLIDINLMARIKHIPRTKLANSRKSSAPYQSSPQEVASPSTTWTAVIELGASNGQAMMKKSGGYWELVRWAQGVGASSVGGAEAIPAMSVLKRVGRPAEMRHGTRQCASGK